jgi:hypothetical protein
MKIEIQLVERDENGMVKRVEILFDHHLRFVFFSNKKGEPELVAWAQIPNNSRYWLGRIWARAHAVFREAPPEPVNFEGESPQLTLDF